MHRLGTRRCHRTQGVVDSFVTIAVGWALGFIAVEGEASDLRGLTEIGTTDT